MRLRDRNCVILRARCALNKEIINLLNEESLERAVVEPVYNFDDKSTASVQKGESTTTVPFKLFLGHIHIEKKHLK